MSTPFKILSLKNKKKDKKNFSNELGDNFRQWGFAGIKDHSVDPSLVTEVVSLFADFFKLPRKVKESYYKAELGGSRGYTPIKIETPKGGKNPDIKEFWHIGRNLDSNDPYRKWMHDNFFINEIPELSEKANLLFCQFDELGYSLLEAVALYLDLEEKYCYVFPLLPKISIF